MTPADLILSQTDGRPMYLQIVEQVRQRIAVGDWPRGAEIPSIRQLAIGLKVSVITVKRAYYELERAGVIVTQPGKGSLVAPDFALSVGLHDEELARHLDQAARLGNLMGLTPEALTDRLRAAIAGSQGATEEDR